MQYTKTKNKETKSVWPAGQVYLLGLTPVCLLPVPQRRERLGTATAAVRLTQPAVAPVIPVQTTVSPTEFQGTSSVLTQFVVFYLYNF